MRASSLGLGAQMADSQTADSTFLTRSVARSTMPTARWFDGAAPAMASSRRDASSPEMAPDVRDATGTGRVTETETDVAAFDAFRVPDVTGVRPDDETTPAKATKRTNAACVSATVVEVARASTNARIGTWRAAIEAQLARGGAGSVAVELDFYVGVPPGMDAARVERSVVAMNVDRRAITAALREAGLTRLEAAWTSGKIATGPAATGPTGGTGGTGGTGSTGSDRVPLLGEYEDRDEDDQ